METHLASKKGVISTVEEIYGDEAYMNTIHKSKPYVELPSDPIPMPVQGPLEIPQHQVKIIWLISELFKKNRHR